MIISQRVNQPCESMTVVVGGLCKRKVSQQQLTVAGYAKDAHITQIIAEMGK